jgi:predicted alpha/beta hydrolase family esterase
LSRDRWHGSGTWGTIFYAHSLGCPVELHPLVEMEPPEWLQQKQLNLF